MQLLRPGDASLNAGKPKFSINLSGSLQVTHHRSFELPDNTILGYACNEITFDSAMGTFELVLADATDGEGMSTRERCVFDEQDGQNGKILLLSKNYCKKSGLLHTNSFPSVRVVGVRGCT